MIPVIEWLQTCNLYHTATGIGFFLRYTKGISDREFRTFWRSSTISIYKSYLIWCRNHSGCFSRWREEKLGMRRAGSDVCFRDVWLFSKCELSTFSIICTSLLFVGTEHHNTLCKFFQTKRIVPLQCSKLWMIIKHVRIQMVKYLIAIPTNNTEWH